ncbi:MAG: glycosyltransferase family 39 protein, partial [Fimbriimonadales bacterium]|nr:glycosyltransferase family 39 protein [Fimbriimonadales bacterium]
GLTAYRYGRFPGWWASLGLAAVPVFLWEIGTAYQDVSHGLFAGAGAVLAAFYLSEKRGEWIALSAVCLGFALATKYTGFFVLVAVLLTLVVFSVFEKQTSQGIKAALVVLALSLLLVSPWLVRNEILRDNPVFPFYSHLFGGKDWSAYNAEAWASEQRQFGVGYGVADFPAAVLGLAMAPDRYANQGSPYYAVGPLLLIGLAYWLFSGRMRREEGALVLILTLSLVIWFATSQQSRYLASLMIPGLFLVGGAIERSSVKGLMKLAVGLQTAWTLFLFVGFPLPKRESGPSQSGYDHLALQANFINKRLVMQVGAMTGRGGSIKEILADTFSFWEGTSMINEIHAGLLGATARQAETAKPRPIKVALFDEPRGYYLHAEYFWANPNYHTLIPYDSIRSPEEFVEALQRLGTTHIYLSLLYINPEERQALMQLMYQPEEAPPLKESFRKWIIEAYAKGLIRRVGVFNHYEGPGEWHGHPQSFLFEIVEGAPSPGWSPSPSE